MTRTGAAPIPGAAAADPAAAEAALASLPLVYHAARGAWGLADIDVEMLLEEANRKRLVLRAGVVREMWERGEPINGEAR